MSSLVFSLSLRAFRSRWTEFGGADTKHSFLPNPLYLEGAHQLHKKEHQIGFFHTFFHQIVVKKLKLKLQLIDESMVSGYFVWVYFFGIKLHLF